MKKNIQISLSDTLFLIDEEACLILEDYIDAVNEQFTQNNSVHLQESFEEKIAKFFVTQQEKHQRDIITLGDIEHIIHSIGYPKSFNNPFAEHKFNKNTHPNYKESPVYRNSSYGNGSHYEPLSPSLYRDPDRAVFSGVCAGWAAYFGINDVVWIRLGFVVAGFMSFGIVLFLYIIMSIIVPEAHTPAEKLAMRGEPVDLSQFEERVRGSIRKINQKIKTFDDDKY